MDSAAAAHTPWVIRLNRDMMFSVLYYETGFEQMHAAPWVVDWMQDQGWHYGRDWGVIKKNHNEHEIWFNSDRAQTLFMMRWA
jgi:hypothetical protein